MKSGIIAGRLVVFISLIVSASCKQELVLESHYQQPTKLEDGLEVASLTSVGIDEHSIAKALAKLKSGSFKGVHSMLIYSQGYLVCEEYFSGYRFKWDAPQMRGELVRWTANDTHETMSVAKSFVATLAGIAIDKGYISDVKDPIFDYLPNHRHLAQGEKKAITVEHLLTQSSGLEWPEWSASYSTNANPTIGIWYSPKDPITYILEKQLLTQPGTSFNYSTGNSVVVGEIISFASRMSLDSFAETYLFKALEIDGAKWYLQYKNGVNATSLKLKPRDMLKLGILYLQEGRWKGEELVSKEWILRSTRPYRNNRSINVPGEDSGLNGYGYMWWTNKVVYKKREYRLYSANGWGGQHIFVLPELELVAVFTGGNYTGFRPPYKILRKYIVPAVLKQSDANGT